MSAGQAMSFIQQASISTANHNCWAYRAGQAHRFSDDGEPGGSAGRPILAAIDGADLDYVAVVVTRYFGGAKLGIGGLVRAYGGSAAQCLTAAPKREVVPTKDAEFEVHFGDLGPIYAIFERYGVAKQSQAFGARGVRLKITYALVDEDPLRRALADATQGRVQLGVAESNK